MVLAQVRGRRGGGAEDVVGPDGEAGVGQGLGDPGAGARGGVGDQRERQVGAAQRLDRRHRAGQGLPGDGEHPVDVDQHRAHAVHPRTVPSASSGTVLPGGRLGRAARSSETGQKRPPPPRRPRVPEPPKLPGEKPPPNPPPRLCRRPRHRSRRRNLRCGRPAGSRRARGCRGRSRSSRRARRRRPALHVVARQPQRLLGHGVGLLGLAQGVHRGPSGPARRPCPGAAAPPPAGCGRRCRRRRAASR